MEEIFSPNSIIDLGLIDLVIVPQLDSALDVTTLKVYEREHFFVDPNPVINQTQIAQYSICPSKVTQAIAEIRDLYAGWSKIDKTEPAKLIGIHNQNPKTLYIQFSLGERYFIYTRCLVLNKESVYEELFGKKHNLRQRALYGEDEQHLISMLKFMPKAKKAISFYPKKAHSIVTHKRRHLFLPSC